MKTLHHLGRLLAPSLAALLLLGASSCSIKRMAARSVANSLTSGPDVFASDDDPELIRDAVPFGLKTMESLLEIVPNHKGLLLGLCRGYTQYAYAFVQLDADLAEPNDHEKAERLRARALKLYLRARRFGLRGLDLEHQGLSVQLPVQPEAAVVKVRRRELPLLYWTAASWGSAIALGKDRPELTADIASVKAMMSRALELDEGFDGGAIHEALIALEALPAMMGGSLDRARQHFHRAVELSRGLKAGPYVTLAENVSIQSQDRREFEEMLHRALAIDPDQVPAERLANLVFQDRARALLRREEDLFLDSEPSSGKEPR